MSDIAQLGPIAEPSARKLQAAGVCSTAQLLQIGASRRGRQTIAMTTAISEKQIYTWVRRADMLRIEGLDSQSAEQLEQAGVSALPELATTNAQTLQLKMQALHDQNRSHGALPGRAELERWIASAKTLPRIIEYTQA